MKDIQASEWKVVNQGKPTIQSQSVVSYLQYGTKNEEAVLSYWRRRKLFVFEKEDRNQTIRKEGGNQTIRKICVEWRTRIACCQSKWKTAQF